MSECRLSIIVPVYNEPYALQLFKDWWNKLSDKDALDLHICIARGTQHNECVRIAESFSHVIKHLELSRGGQMNTGAGYAKAEILFFLHVDSRPPVNFIKIITNILCQDGVIAGAFSHRFTESPRSRSLRAISVFNRIRYYISGNYYGDQGLFLKREDFNSIGGFPERPVLEDVYIIRRLRKLGKVVCVPEIMTTSGRRFLANGPWRTFFLMWGILCMDFFGMDLTRSANWYEQEGNKARKF
jgi:rSAM/selenodomain-associated transferase 2